MNKREVMGMAADAQRLPAREAPYRNFVLNQRIDVTASPFLAADIWQACADEPRVFRGLRGLRRPRLERKRRPHRAGPGSL